MNNPALTPERTTPFREQEHVSEGHHVPFTESVIWSSVVFFLCVADAALTITHVSRGAGELNPLMDYLLEIGPGVFAGVKIMLSAAALVLLCVYLPRVRCARLCYGGLGALYLGVFLYHVSGFVLASAG